MCLAWDANTPVESSQYLWQPRRASINFDWFRYIIFCEAFSSKLFPFIDFKRGRSHLNMHNDTSLTFLTSSIELRQFREKPKYGNWDLMEFVSSLRASLYPTPGIVGSSPHPYVCSWIAGDTYCGKRFPSSEELLQHLRTHTNISTTESSSLPLHLLHHHSLLTGHPSLPRSYPTPPLSPLSAARYHPYVKSTLPHLPPGAPLSSAASALSAASLSALTPHPLSAYYNPYSLYARGLGATVGLHP